MNFLDDMKLDGQDDQMFELPAGGFDTEGSDMWGFSGGAGGAGGGFAFGPGDDFAMPEEGQLEQRPAATPVPEQQQAAEAGTQHASLQRQATMSLAQSSQRSIPDASPRPHPGAGASARSVPLPQSNKPLPLPQQQQQQQQQAQQEARAPEGPTPDPPTNAVQPHDAMPPPALSDAQHRAAQAQEAPQPDAGLRVFEQRLQAVHEGDAASSAQVDAMLKSCAAAVLQARLLREERRALSEAVLADTHEKYLVAATTAQLLEQHYTAP